MEKFRYHFVLGYVGPYRKSIDYRYSAVGVTFIHTYREKLQKHGPVYIKLDSYLYISHIFLYWFESFE